MKLTSCFREYTNDLPAHLLAELDEPEFGIKYLAQTEEALFRVYQPT
ncbi:hypothetical protein [Algicola sagamiensis]|nr:hypothetical protein [Algicola sagamiensis]